MVHLTLSLRTLLHVVEILGYLFLLISSCQISDELTLRRQHHKGDTKHRIGTCGEDGEVLV